MKSTIMKINIMLLGCFLSVAIANAQGPSAIDNNTEVKHTTGKYTGYWYIKSGDEFYLVRSGNLPPGLIKKTADNKVEDIDVEAVKRAVNFRKESNINGKPVDNYYFVIEEGEGEGNTASLATEAIYSRKNYNSLNEMNAEGINGTPLNNNKSDNKTTDAEYTLTFSTCSGNISDYKICAIWACYGMQTIGWAAYNACGYSSSIGSVCIGYKVNFPQVAPYYYYIICGSTN